MNARTLAAASIGSASGPEPGSSRDLLHRPRLKILTISCVFPNPAEPDYGLFVRRRLLGMLPFADVTVVAPVPVVDYSNPKRNWFAGWSIPFKRNDSGIEVYHPKWFYPPSGGVLNSVFLFLRLLVPAFRMRRRLSYAVIDSHFGYPDGIAAALLGAALGCPFTITMRGNETMHAQLRWRRAGLIWALRRASRIVTVSESLRKFAVSLSVDPGKVVTVPNGVDSKTFYPRNTGGIRSRYGIPENAKLLLSAGYLIECKGHHRVVRALSDLRKDGADVHLLIAGGPGQEGGYEAQLRQTIAGAELAAYVHFTGRVDPPALAELMSAADIFCLASSREGWPNVVHEAMACGAPVVAMDVGGVGDMIPREEYGFVVPAGDDAALTRALGKALKTRWDRTAICQWAHSRSWDRVAEETLAELSRAAGGKRKEEISI